ncbi:hypothetical protein LBMAG57_36430 [Verrucomicrobiota bacterium]|nr:hypothetical protein LBMAG57_36430 [Verrucomicrobiota bacterium]
MAGWEGVLLRVAGIPLVLFDLNWLLHLKCCEQGRAGNEE